MIALILFACFSKAVDPKTASSENQEIPTVTVSEDFYPPAPIQSQLDNGSELWLVENHDLPLIVLDVVLPGGYGADSEGKWGRANLAASMLSEASGDLSAVDVSSQLYMLAVDISTSAYSSNTIVSVSMHKDRLAEVLPIVADMIYRPSFTDQDWARVHEQQVFALQQARKDPRSVSFQFGNYFLHGTGHPLGVPSSGTPATLNNLAKEEVQDWHHSRLIGTDISFVLVGDITIETAKTTLMTHFPEWSGAGYSVPNPSTDTGLSDKILLVDMPDAQQTTIRVLSNAYSFGSDESEAAQLAAKIMGGSFTSRLNSLLREEKGYTYGIGCRFSSHNYGNTFSLSTSVRTDVTAEALIDIYSTLQTGSEGYSPEEVNKSKVLDRTDRIEGAESRHGLANDVLSLVILELSPDFQGKEIRKISLVTAEDMQKASRFFNPERGITLMVGDASVISEPLTASGFSFEVVELPE